jgi:prophage antirepressor-like protein
MNTLNSSVNTDSSLTEIQVFENTEFGKIRSLIIDNEPWFVGKDVAESLGYKDTSDALKKHIDEDDKLGRQIADSGQKRMTYIINESGLYSLILGSKLESAKKFKRWVTSEVLPSIRKTGNYTTVTVHQDSPLEKAKFLHEIAENYAETPVYMQILDAYAVKEITGKFVLPLPESTQQDYSATEVGIMLGISANKVGSIANKLGIKTEEFGRWCIDKSPYSSKEVRTFRYYMNAVEKLRKEINVTGAQK